MKIEAPKARNGLLCSIPDEVMTKFEICQVSSSTLGETTHSQKEVSKLNYRKELVWWLVGETGWGGC